MSDRAPPIQFANNDGIHIAYRSDGAGPDVLFTASATVTSKLAWPWLADLIGEARVTTYDKRGIGASDGAANFSFEERMDDIGAVMDAVGIEAAHLIGASEGGPLSILFAATYPERVRSLTLVGTFPSFMRRRDYPHGRPESLSEFSRFVDRVIAAMTGDREAMEWFWGELWAPALARQPGFYDFMASVPVSTSPSATRLIWESMYDADVRSLLPSIQVPTTIVHVVGDRVAPIEGGRYLAEHIPGAEIVELPGDDHFQLEPPSEIADTIRRHLARDDEPARNDASLTERRLATVLFTDIVDSTATAVARGDDAWTTALELHDIAAARVVEAHQGRIVKTTGDGLVATFDGPSRAVDCAAALHAEIANIGLPIRAGLHTGEIELRSDGDIAGIGVHIAARVSGLAGSGETIVSRTVRDLCVGSGHAFADAGEHELKGVEDRWQCHRLES